MPRHHQPLPTPAPGPMPPLLRLLAELRHLSLGWALVRLAWAAATSAAGVTLVALGLAWLISTLIAAAVTVLCFAVRGVGAVFVVALLAAAALVPIAQQGHAAGTASHTAAVTALGLRERAPEPLVQVDTMR